MGDGAAASDSQSALEVWLLGTSGHHLPGETPVSRMLVARVGGR